MAPYPAGYEFPVPFGGRPSLLGSSCPRRGICLPCGRLTAGRHREMIPGRPRRDFRVPHDERCDRGGCLLCAGAEVSAAGPMEPRFVRPRRRLPPPGSSPIAAVSAIGYGSSLHHDALCRRFNRSPVRSSPRPDFPDGWGCPWAFIRASHRPVTGTACWMWRQSWTLLTDP